MSVLDIQDLNLILLIQGGTRIGMQSGLDLPLTREIESRERAVYYSQKMSVRYQSIDELVAVR
jgi:hypothetical protein